MINGNFTKTPKINGVGGALPQPAILFDHRHRDIRIKPIVKEMPAAMAGKLRI